MKGNLIIVRGLPGSGKTTKAKEILQRVNADHFEADMFFIDNNGDYKFVPCDIAEAHDWCFNQTRKSLDDGINVVVSNTFVKKWELEKYMNLDCATIAIIETTGDYGSVHGVPEDTINRMKKNWYALPTDWRDEA